MDNPGILKGIYFGVATIISSILLYTINPSYYLNYRVIILFIISFYFLYQASLIARNSLGGYITVGESFVPSFSTWVVGTLIATIFAYIFINFIDPSLPDLMLEMALDSADQMEGFIGEEAAETVREGIEENGVNLGIGAMLATWLFGLLLGAFEAFVISLIVKRKDDSFA